MAAGLRLRCRTANFQFSIFNFQLSKKKVYEDNFVVGGIREASLAPVE
jgi:hypothetical protein